MPKAVQAPRRLAVVSRANVTTSAANYPTWEKEEDSKLDPASSGYAYATFWKRESLMSKLHGECSNFLARQIGCGRVSIKLSAPSV